MADILVKSIAYLLVTNNYVIPFLPALFGKFPGDQYYALIKYMFFFGITFLITFLIFMSHNSGSIKKEDLDKEKLSLWDVSMNDALTMMVIVLILYFGISMLLPVQLIKLEFDYIFNSIFIIVSFAIIGAIYAAITDINLKFKTVNGIKNIVLGVILLVLFVLYTLNDEAISGTIPGLNLIPPQVKQILNLAIKLGDPDNMDQDVLDKLKASLDGALSDGEFNRLLSLTKSALRVLPEPAQKLIDTIKSKQHILDKLLGPFDVSNSHKVKEVVANPLFKLLLTDPNYVINTVVEKAQDVAQDVAEQAQDVAEQAVASSKVIDTTEIENIPDIEATTDVAADIPTELPTDTNPEVVQEGGYINRNRIRSLKSKKIKPYKLV